ncbi:MAG TPA: hypothetical protein VHU80_20890 [Polyangiaceae bacterium]|jgi:hypothetical protein|nr:hypothetical protein [Polyangiaceae bacterium]
MIRIKALAAIGLAGLGGATMGTDVYLASRQSTPPATEAAKPNPPPPRVARPLPVPRARVDQDVVELPPYTIYSRVSARKPHVRQKTPELVPCSNWRSLAAGPEGRGVRALCTPPSVSTR